MDFEKIKHRVAFKLINKSNNVYSLSEIPHTDFLDLTFVYYVIVHMDEFGVDTILITNEYLEEWGVSDRELHSVSRQNFAKIFAMEVFETENKSNIKLLTTKYKMFGGVYLSYTGLIECFSELYNDDICIIPSSIHEIIILPAEGIVKEDMDQIIRSVNKETVSGDEYLSDHMYLFSREKKQIIY